MQDAVWAAASDVVSLSYWVKGRRQSRIKRSAMELIRKKKKDA